MSKTTDVKHTAGKIVTTQAWRAAMSNYMLAVQGFNPEGASQCYSTFSNHDTELRAQRDALLASLKAFLDWNVATTPANLSCGKCGGYPDHATPDCIVAQAEAAIKLCEATDD